MISDSILHPNGPEQRCESRGQKQSQSMFLFRKTVKHRQSLHKILLLQENPIMLWKVTSFLKPNPNNTWNKSSILNLYFRFPICQHIFFLPKNALRIKKMQQPVDDNWIYNYFSLMFPLMHLVWKQQRSLVLSLLDFWNWSSWQKQVNSDIWNCTGNLGCLQA